MKSIYKDIQFIVKTKITDFSNNEFDEMDKLCSECFNSKLTEETKFINCIPYHKDFVCCLVYKDNEMIGMIHGSLAYGKYDNDEIENLLIKNKPVSILKEFCIKNQFRGNRIGRKLLNLIEFEFRKRNYGYTILHPLNDRVEKFYKKVGYRIIKEVDKGKHSVEALGYLKESNFLYKQIK